MITFDECKELVIDILYRPKTDCPKTQTATLAESPKSQCAADNKCRTDTLLNDHAGLGSVSIVEW